MRAGNSTSVVSPASRSSSGRVAAAKIPSCSSTATLGASAWVRANFHAHAASDILGDDGAERPADLHQALRAHGFDFSVHTPHSTVNRADDTPKEMYRKFGFEIVHTFDVWLRPPL